jgi:hypothetical protein
MTTDEVTVSNHSIPQFHLREWSEDGTRVSTYQLLVPHVNVPRWKKRSVEYSAVHDHLYTSALATDRPDHFEKWIKREVEDPAVEPIAKIIAGMRLTAPEWNCVSRFVFALSARTPAEYFRSTKRWSVDLRPMLTEIMDELPQAMVRARQNGAPLAGAISSRVDLPVPLKTWAKPSEKPGLSEFHVAVSVGRSFWLNSIKHVLNETVNVVGPVEWSVMLPHPGSQWFTSDDPVIRLDFNSLDDYNSFAGGWGRKGSEVLVPISPGHLLYRQAGHRHPPVMQATSEQTLLIQRFIAEHAFREIYASGTPLRAEIFRPRTVNADVYKYEQAQWSAWNDDQSASELDPRGNAADGIEAA